MFSVFISSFFLFLFLGSREVLHEIIIRQEHGWRVEENHPRKTENSERENSCYQKQAKEAGQNTDYSLIDQARFWNTSIDGCVEELPNVVE